MTELPPNDPRLSPMPDELNAPDDDVLTNTASDVFHRIDGDGTPVCRTPGNYAPRPRNTLPRREPCDHCFPSYADGEESARSAEPSTENMQLTNSH